MKLLNGSFKFKQNVTKQWEIVEVSMIDFDIHGERIIDMAEEVSSEPYAYIYDERLVYFKFSNKHDANEFREWYVGVS